MEKSRRLIHFRVDDIAAVKVNLTPKAQYVTDLIGCFPKTPSKPRIHIQVFIQRSDVLEISLFDNSPLTVILSFVND
jgi:hypothetical protein